MISSFLRKIILSFPLKSITELFVEISESTPKFSVMSSIKNVPKAGIVPVRRISLVGSKLSFVYLVKL